MKQIRVVSAAILLILGTTQESRTWAQESATPTFESAVQPFLKKNCMGCHNATSQAGGLNLEAYASRESMLKDRAKWDGIQQRIVTGEMPPAGAGHPTSAELKSVLDWIAGEFQRTDAQIEAQPGRVTARRLNRAEYNNTVRDLLAVDFKPADDFPVDDAGYGFDNIADSLSLSPVLMEKYLTAAERVARRAIFGLEPVKPTVVRHQPPYRSGSDGGNNRRFAEIVPYTVTDYDVTGFSLPSALHAWHNFPAEGEYEFRMSPEGNRPKPSDTFHAALWIDGKQMATMDFEASDNSTGMEGDDRVLRLRVPAGEHWVAATGLRLFEGLPAKYGGLKPTPKPEPAPGSPAAKVDIPPPEPGITPEQVAARRALFTSRANRPPAVTDVSFRFNFIEIKGPFDQHTQPSVESLKKVFTCGHLDGHHTAECARKIVSDISRRAFRRPTTAEEVNRYLAVVTNSRKDGASFNEAIANAITAMLVSPNFLFRIENEAQPSAAAATAHPVNQLELATRLSYFLWSSTPDDELLRVAEQGSLRQPAVLSAQVGRMLKDAKAHALVENFGGQWLQFRAMESVKPDLERFMVFDDYVRYSMQQETELFFEDIMRADRSVLLFLNGKHTFLNEKLARLYGIPGVNGPEFRKVDLTGTARAGVLTQGSTLTVSSYATRTSVVLRGKWVLENLLNSPVPPPPPDVPALNEAAVGTEMSLRAQMEQHRKNPACSSCHGRMDPIGFGLENFDAVGRWRTMDGKFPIDASGSLPDGKTFNGTTELIGYLSSKADVFAEGLSAKMLIYALGRGLEPYDQPAIKKIAADVVRNDYRFSSLVLGIVNSLPFQQRKGEKPANVSSK